MSAQIYNQKRRIIFSTYHRDGSEKAFQYLEGYRKILGEQSYTGLRAELNFYHQYGKEFHLTIAGDMGEHADFSGLYGSLPVRFDVTTNLLYKELSTYERFITDGYNYKIALYDQKNFEIKDILELSFPKCNKCGDGFIFPLALLLPMNYNRHGDPLWHNDQELIEFCPICEHLERREELYNNTIKTTSELCNEIPEEYTQEEVNLFITSEHRNSIKYLSKTTNINLIGIVEKSTMQQSKYDIEENVLYFPYLADVVKSRFSSLYYI